MPSGKLLLAKTKCMTEGEFIVVGMEPNPGGAPFALLVREAADVGAPAQR